MDELTNEELQRAAERVREMSRRANIQPGRHQRPPMPDFVSAPGGNNREPPAPQQETIHPVNTAKPASPINSLFKMINFKNIEMDGDISLVMGILLLLSGENSDELLSLALLYIMM